ncbi:MAG: hypothetical protein K8R36_05495 [Planctomycetales bacterium]|nr:hypothetical protein [Planctomycetales bacterium]
MKYSIRDLFLVTVIVALVLGWWVDHWRNATLEEERDQALDDAKFLAKWGSFRLGSNGELAATARDVLAKYGVEYSSKRDQPQGAPMIEIAPGRYIGEMPTSRAPAPNSPKP